MMDDIKSIDDDDLDEEEGGCCFPLLRAFSGMLSLCSFGHDDDSKSAEIDDIQTL
jgi:hypothetical protein